MRSPLSKLWSKTASRHYNRDGYPATWSHQCLPSLSMASSLHCLAASTVLLGRKCRQYSGRSDRSQQFSTLSTALREKICGRAAQRSHPSYIAAASREARGKFTLVRTTTRFMLLDFRSKSER